MLALAVYLNIGVWEMLALAALLLLFIILRAKANEGHGGIDHVGGDGIRQDEDWSDPPNWGPGDTRRAGFQPPKSSKP